MQTCEQNCYLGSNLYSAPLKGDNCCEHQRRGNCNTFMMINDHDFICRQCQFGYQHDESECVEIKDGGIDKKQKCYNPDIRSVYFDSCSVCKIDKSGVYVPVKDPANPNIYKCKPTSLRSKEAAKLAFCKASAIFKDNVLCHECNDGYYYNGLADRCTRYTPALEGCLISFVDKKCEICRPSHQYDIRTNQCIKKDKEIDYAAYQSDMQKKMAAPSEDNGMGNPMFQQMMMLQMMQQQNSGNQSVGNINFNANMGGADFITGANPQMTRQAVANPGPFTRGYYRKK